MLNSHYKLEAPELYNHMLQLTSSASFGVMAHSHPEPNCENKEYLRHPIQEVKVALESCFGRSLFSDLLSIHKKNAKGQQGDCCVIA